MSIRWLDPQPVTVPEALRESVGGHPLVAETLVRRGVVDPGQARAFLDPEAYHPASPSDLPDLDLAVERLWQAIDRRERVLVWGDFDADGQTATAVLLEALHALDADVDFYVPARHEGHGLHRGRLGELVTGGARLILTCDTGVTAHRAVAHANELGADVIITDHHVPADTLPPALAVVNPHRLPAGHPLATVPGVGVAYELARALEPSAARHSLDLVALGTVADVATLIGDARYLVQVGLEALRHTERPGLQAIYQAAGVKPLGLTEEHVGFALGPRLNALGRLAHAAQGVELLTTTSSARARILAAEVEALNSRRQWLTKQITGAALAQVERDPSLLRDYRALVLSHPRWPGGVVGIVAGRLAERLGLPAVLISAPEGQIARGSARSVPGVDLVAVLNDCAHLLAGYGGHAGAAGFSIEPERIDEFRSALSRAVAARSEAIPEPTVSVDAYVELPDLTLDLVAELSRLAPFGAGNPALTLAVRDVRVLSEATIGRTEEHRRVTVEDTQDRTQTVFWWHGADWPLPEGRFDLALALRASDYRGAPEVQVQWLAARPLAVEPEQVSVPARAIVVRDYREEPVPQAVLDALLAEGELQVWAEGDRPEGIDTRTRQQLEPGRRLAVWTAPPGPRQLQGVLACVQPSEVLLFALDPGLDEPDAFLTRLAGLAKYALRAREGWVDLEAAAAATSQREAAIRQGLEWLAAVGQIRIAERGADRWRLGPGPGEAGREMAGAVPVHARLEALLAEAAAYRAYCQTAPPDSLIG